MRNYLRPVWTLGFFGSLAFMSCQAATIDAADKILFNANVLTMDAAKPSAQAIAIRGDTIVAVGANSAVRKLANARTQLVDLGGRTVVPGLIDTHIHAIRGGQTYSFESYWYDETSLATALGKLKAEAEKRGDGKWVAVTGAWHPDQFDERRAPTPAELSAAMPNNPAYVQYLYDYALLNAKAIEVLGLNNGAAIQPGITVERDANGKATGKILGGIGPFSALFVRISSQPESQYTESLKKFFGAMNQQGVTGIVDAAAGDFNAYSPVFTLWRNKQLSLRVAYRSSPTAPGNETASLQNMLTFLPPKFGDDMLRYLGVGEVLVFGMHDGVTMGPGFSPTPAAKAEFQKIATMAAARGYPLEIHAYTDDAANAILDVMEEVAKTYPLRDLRWAITHINTGKEATFERMRKLGLFYTVQMGPYFEGPAIRSANGDEVAQASPPTRIALNKGLMVAGGTDSTRIGVVNVWRAIEYHITGRSVGGVVQRRADYLLSREEALRLYTANAAWVTFDEDKRGSISSGKLADIAVLNAPFMSMPADKIHSLRSALTLVGGRVVYADPALASSDTSRGGKQVALRSGNRVRADLVMSAIATMRDKEEAAEAHAH